MPEKIKLEDGSEREVPTEEELKELNEIKASHESSKEQVEAFSKLRETLGIEEGQSVEDKIKELKDSANPNWQKFRSNFNAMKKTLKDKGVEVDEDTGEIRSNEKGLSEERIVELLNKTIDDKLNSFSSKTTKEQALSKFSEEDRSKIEPVLEKVMALGGDIEENLAIAEAKVFPGRNINTVKNAYNNAGGHGAPMGQGNEDSFDKSDQGQSAASAMNLSFAKKDDNKSKE